ncbi:CIC11C00000003655 [Sungouiella intermedia]|uniref:CIC11C00000003655 n=1 Tax=Sungouiella intermedia TaxID=45354 RepID=A0A1L0BNU0_9ASCO|nr:CIC11C00000003655 [[Candida] intermedia]
MRDLVAHMRIFNRCYVEREDAPFRNAQDKFIQKQNAELNSLSTKFVSTDAEVHLNKDAFHLCSDLQAKVYPWIHDSFPIYQRHTGDILRSPPRMSKYVSEHEVISATDHKYSSGKGIKKPVHSALTDNKQCWINEFKNKISGKGIVIPFTLTSFEDTLNLIHLLRALGNKYPVQIVYYSDMTKEHKEKLVDAARRPFTDMPQSFSKVSDLIDKLALDHKTNGFIPLELWLVDASSMVSEHFQTRLSTVPIIAWASVVNSFEEFILMDPLASPLQNPKYFFDLPEYRQKVHTSTETEHGRREISTMRNSLTKCHPL